jgi:hypothetical protein
MKRPNEHITEICRLAELHFPKTTRIGSCSNSIPAFSHKAPNLRVIDDNQTLSICPPTQANPA